MFLAKAKQFQKSVDYIDKKIEGLKIYKNELCAVSAVQFDAHSMFEAHSIVSLSLTRNLGR